ncbi:MAG TPA: NHLP bacteriocin export ABC transporter permease/ATPase subunit [Chloroflexia bacterium]|nr:NHLP bacteriocin export ABC transporter permease/ATPase subunit [Chloroflexia bacterium]
MTIPLNITLDTEALEVPSLLITSGPEQGRQIKLDFAQLAAKPLLVGRQSADCDVVLQTASNQVSRRHFMLSYRSAERLVIISDAGSANGTLLNRAFLAGPAPLYPGDVIGCGDVELVFVVPGFALSGQSPEKKLPGGLPSAGSALQTESHLLALRFAGQWELQQGPALLALPRAGRSLQLGRAKNNDLRLNDPSISRTHARLFMDKAAWWITDEGSTNGTLVNDRPITESTKLNPGDRLQLGEFQFVLEAFEPAGAQEEVALLDKPVTLQLAPLAAPDKTFYSSTRLLTSDAEFNSQLISPRQIEAAVKAAEQDVVYDEWGELVLPERILANGILLRIGGNEAFLLDNPQAVWLLRSGRAEIFAVQVSGDRVTNARHHVCSVVPGQAIFGNDSNRYGEGLALLVAATPGTELLKLPTETFWQIAGESGLKRLQAQWLEGWLESLSAKLAEESAPSGWDFELTPNQTLALKTGQKARAAGSGLWVKLNRGEILFAGEEEISAEAGPVYFPLYGNTWLEATGEAQLSTTGLGHLLNESEVRESLDRFYELFFKVKFNAIRRQAYNEQKRLKARAEHDRKVGQAALERLSNILAEEKGDNTHASTEQDLLLAACRLIGEVQGLNFNAPQRTNPHADPLAELVRNSRLRVRKVTLEADWWKHESGPIMGYLAEKATPVALLPNGKQQYWLVNPLDGSRRKVNRAVAGELLPDAYVFYRPFPDTSLNALDLLKFGLQGCRNDLLVMLALAALGGLLGLAVPVLTAYLFDTVIPGGRVGLVWQILIALVVVALSGAAFQATRGVAILRLETRLQSFLQAAVWDRLLRLPPGFFRNYSAGDLASRALGINTIQKLISSSVVTTLLGTLFSLFSLALLFTYEARLAMLALVLTLISLGAIGFSQWRQLKFRREQASFEGRIAGLVLQLLGGIAKLRVGGAETRAFAVWAGLFSRQRRLAFKARLANNNLLVFNAAWTVITSLVIFGAVGALNAQTISTGIFLAFLAAFGQFLSAVLQMAEVFSAVSQALPIYERTKPILESQPEVTQATTDPGKLEGGIELNEVSFRYAPDGPEILSGVSLQVKPGQFVAIVGPSGSGKSSLLRLLLGFERPAGGSIYYDNQDLAGLDIEAVRQQIGVVMQHGKLLPGDIFTNIVGTASFSMDDAWEAARLAGIEYDIRQMPMGLFTVVSEGGSTLSGGQRQRLLIARAIIGRPRLLFLDEATSALDNETQAVVSHSLERLEATRIVIAHRLSTVEKADCIYVLQDGKIAQSGTYQELMTQPGPFRELAARQLT